MQRLVASAALVASLSLIFLGIASPSAAVELGWERILIKPKSPAALNALNELHRTKHTVVLSSFAGMGGLQILQLPPGLTPAAAVADYQKSGLVEFAEPDYVRHLAATLPNDPKFLDGTLWGLNNTGQSGGAVDADIDAPEAWDLITSASNVIVAVLDTGIRYTHEDLASNMWTSPNDGSHGINVFTGSNDPMDDEGHGSLCAGVLGAVGNNGKGIAGVAWKLQMMSCKCFDSARNGTDSGILACLDYALTNGARIVNASFGSYSNSQSLSNAISALRNAGIIVVAACGNDGRNIDAAPYFPASYKMDNVVSVAYTTRNDLLGPLSNYGGTNVHLAAPGAAMYSTFWSADNAYLGGDFLQGTSFAAPYVAGALALVLQRFPAESYQSAIRRVLEGVDPLPSLAGKCATGGRLNLRNALSPLIRISTTNSGGVLQLRVAGGPNRLCVIETTTNLTSWSPVFTNTTSAAGTFDFSDTVSTASDKRFYRAVSTP